MSRNIAAAVTDRTGASTASAASSPRPPVEASTVEASTVEASTVEASAW
ncbi:hypothetical protein [Streptomyces sp. NPDC060131]